MIREFVLRCTKCKSDLVRKFELEKNVSEWDMVGMTFIETCPRCNNTDDFPIIKEYFEEV